MSSKKKQNQTKNTEKKSNKNNHVITILLIALVLIVGVLLTISAINIFKPSDNPTDSEVEQEKILVSKMASYLKEKYNTEVSLVDATNTAYLFAAQSFNDSLIAVYDTSLLDSLSSEWKRYFTGDFVDDGYAVVCQNEIASTFAKYIPDSFGTFRVISFFGNGATPLIFPSDVNAETSFGDVLYKYAALLHCNTQLYILTDQDISQEDFQQLCQSLSKLDIGMKVYTSKIPAESQPFITISQIASSWSTQNESLYCALLNYPEDSEENE